MSRRHRGPAEHGARRARRGAVRDGVLALLAERPMHGYELITEMEARSGGRWRPSPGAIYPALARMEERGLITAKALEDKKVFSLTDRGRELLESLDVEGGDPTPPPWQGPGRGRGELRALFAEIGGQGRQLGRFGSPDQVERATAALAGLRQQLYAILSDGPADDTDVGAVRDDTDD